jgi:precorrin-2 dehydrogenase / sirohydrochlorin ferrochelatase
VFPATFPVNLDLRGRRVLVVGAGPVAARKVAGLRGAGAVVTVVAPDAVAEIADDPDLRWHRREYRRGEVASYRLAITATDDPSVNAQVVGGGDRQPVRRNLATPVLAPVPAQVARDAEAANVFVNSADDPINCTFILPAVVTRGDLQLTASTNGRSPAFSQWVRRELEGRFTDVHARVLDVLSEVRDEARAEFGTSELPQWADAIDDELFDLVTSGRDGEARDRVRATLGLTARPPSDTVPGDTVPSGAVAS